MGSFSPASKIVSAAFLFACLAAPSSVQAGSWAESHHIATAPVSTSYQGSYPSFPQAVPSQPAAPNPSAGSDISLLTQSGMTLGLEASHYRYQENVVKDPEFMHLSGYHGGVSASATQAFDYGIFLTGDVRFNYGQDGYGSASASADGIEDYLWEMRGLVGKDFVIGGGMPGLKDQTGGKVTVSAYTGLGYRNLFNDLKMATTVDAAGYRRVSEYLYLPVGFTPRFRLDSQSRLSTNVEFDYLIRGVQTTYLSDVSDIYPDFDNVQHTGYGLRGSVMYERNNWSIGPYVQYWNIQQSAMTLFYDTTGTGHLGDEPHNYTLEYGVRGTFRFDWNTLGGIFF